MAGTDSLVARGQGRVRARTEHLTDGGAGAVR
jgi:hypothetical protein